MISIDDYFANLGSVDPLSPGMFCLRPGFARDGGVPSAPAEVTLLSGGTAGSRQWAADKRTAIRRKGEQT